MTDTPEIPPKTPPAKSTNDEIQRRTCMKDWLDEYFEEQMKSDEGRKKLLEALKNPSIKNNISVEIDDYFDDKIDNKTENVLMITDKERNDFLTEQIRKLDASIMNVMGSRKKLEEQVERQINKWFDTTGRETDIQDAIADATESDLKSAKISPRAAAKLLTSYTDDEFVRYDTAGLLRKIGIDPGSLTDELRSVIDNFIATGDISPEQVSALITSQRGAPRDTQKKIVEYLLPEITWKEATDSGLLDSVDAEATIDQAYLEHLRRLGLEYRSVTEALDDRDISEEDRKIRRSMFRQLKKDIQTISIPTKDIIEKKHDALDRFFDDTRSEADWSPEHPNNPKTPHQLLMSGMADSILINKQLDLELRKEITTFEECKEYIRNSLPPSIMDHIENLDSLGAGSYVISDRHGLKKHWKILNIDHTYRALRSESYNDFGQPMPPAFSSYEEFAEAFIGEARDFSDHITIQSETPEFIDYDERYNDVGTLLDFLQKIDAIDDKNMSIPFREGITITLQDPNSKGKEYCRITSIDEHTKEITITDCFGASFTLSWARFLVLIEPLGSGSEHIEFHRYGDISTRENFVKNSGIAGLEMHDGAICHGKDKNGKPAKLWGFQHKDDKTFVEVEQNGDTVRILRWIVKDKKYDKREYITGDDAYYPLEMLKQFLEREGYTKPCNQDPITQQIPPSEEHHHYHSNKWYSSLLKARTLGNLSEAFKMGWHAFTHSIEENRSIHAAEMFYNMTSWMDPSNPIRINAMAEFSGKIGEMIDKKISHLNQLSAGPKRMEIHHILLTKPPKAFDLLAALIVTVQMSGHLYPDSHLETLQGHDYLWFRQLTAALGIPYNEAMTKAMAKAKDMNEGTSDHVHETTLITAFFKSYSETNPYIQAIRAGSKYWNAVTEGRNAQEKKGADEVKEYASAADKKAYILSKMKSNELEIMVGAMSSLYGKDPSPKHMGPLFAWSMSNAARTTHTDVSITLKNHAWGGMIFHGMLFSGNPAEATVYQRTVSAVVKHLSLPGGPLAGTTAERDLEKIEKRRDANNDAHDGSIYLDLSKFWDTYYSVLNPVLSGADPTLFLMAAEEGNQNDVQSYIAHMGGTVDRAVKKPGEDFFHDGHYDYDASIMFSTTEDNKYFSLRRQLEHIGVNPQRPTLNSTTEKVLWNHSIIPYITSLKTNPNFTQNPEYQKEQFKVIYTEIMNFFSERFGSSEELWNKRFLKQKYAKDLINLGFPLLYEDLQSSDIGGIVQDYNVDAVYAHFINHDGRGVAGVADQTRAGAHAAMVMGSDKKVDPALATTLAIAQARASSARGGSHADIPVEEEAAAIL